MKEKIQLSPEMIKEINLMIERNEEFKLLELRDSYPNNYTNRYNIDTHKFDIVECNNLSKILKINDICEDSSLLVRHCKNCNSYRKVHINPYGFIECTRCHNYCGGNVKSTKQLKNIRLKVVKDNSLYISKDLLLSSYFNELFKVLKKLEVLDYYVIKVVLEKCTLLGKNSVSRIIDNLIVNKEIGFDDVFYYKTLLKSYDCAIGKTPINLDIDVKTPRKFTMEKINELLEGSGCTKAFGRIAYKLINETILPHYEGGR